MYVIQNEKDQNLYWSNVEGWGDAESATAYTEAETQILHLPMEGVWKLIRSEHDTANVA